MATRYYSNVAPPTTLTAGVNAITTTITIASAAGLPPFQPFTLAIDPNTPTMELVEVVSAAGTTLTVTRAIDGTSASNHSAGAVVMHVSSARDFAEANTHINASTNVHGLTGGAAVVGTTELQTLTNKTLTSPTINGGSIVGATHNGGSLTGTFTGNPILSGNPQFNGTITGGVNILGDTAAEVTTKITAAPAQSADIFQVVDEAGDVALRVFNGGVDQTRVRGTLRVDALTGQNAQSWTKSNLTQATMSEDGVLDSRATFVSGASIVTAATGWSTSGASLSVKGGFGTLSVSMVRTGAPIVATSTGNITDSVVGTIGNVWGPHRDTPATPTYISIFSSGSFHGSIGLNPDTNVMTALTLAPTATIATNDTITFMFSYPVDNAF